MPEPVKTKNTSPSVPEIVPKKKSFMLDWYYQYYQSVTIVVCLLVVVLSCFFVIYPKFIEARSLTSVALIDAKTKQDFLKKRIEYLTNLEAKRNQMSTDDLARIDEILPSDPGLPEIFGSIEGIGRETGVTIESIQLAEVAPVINKEEVGVIAQNAILPPGVKALEISITVTSTDYSKVKDLVSNIEKSLRLMDVVALNYSPSAESYNLIIHSYYLIK